MKNKLKAIKNKLNAADVIEIDGYETIAYTFDLKANGADAVVMNAEVGVGTDDWGVYEFTREQLESADFSGGVVLVEVDGEEVEIACYRKTLMNDDE